MNDELNDIPGYEGLYAVTRDGRVWSYPKKWLGHGHNGIWLKPTIVSGYPFVSLSKKHSASEKTAIRAYGVHRLVAMTYIPAVPGKPHVNHIDHSRNNNHYTNLEWVTRSENTLHAAKIGRMARFIPKKYTAARINLIRELGDNNMKKTAIARLLDMPHTTVCAILNGKMRVHG